MNIYTLPLYVAGFKGGLKGIGLALPESVSCDFWLPLGSAWCRGVCVLSFVRVAEVGGVSCQFSGCNLLLLGFRSEKARVLLYSLVSLWVGL